MKVPFRPFLQVLFATGTLTISACGLLKGSKDSTTPPPTAEVIPESVKMEHDSINGYQPAREKSFDLIHTDLSLRFDLTNQWVLGRATLKVKPHFYASNQLELDARGFKINSVELIDGDHSKPIKYTYDDSIIHLTFDQVYTRKDTVRLVVDYVAHPGQNYGNIKSSKSEAGFVFVNPEGKPGKPIEFWTQGETETNRCWFPTIDAPNQKSTHTINLTVPKSWVTLSNGELDYSMSNGDGTKTDTWRQTKPISPYLFMVAGGQFKVVHDHWKDLDVDYYLEEKYAPYAKQIFGKTPQMIDFFSQRLGVEYPWQKYSQIVLRDFFGGAMENVSAVTFGDFANLTPKELLDNDVEATISHELFHHWFGDLVTCESWANLPLNESFATYGEYLWDEFESGRDIAENVTLGNKSAYFREAQLKSVSPIRFYYDDPDDMFDSHTYARGGVVLNMLRNEIGDDAFFESLKQYLTRYAYKSAEIHNLRLICEEVTGRDLNWFFNQWFLQPGHPVINVKSTVEAGKVTLNFTQTNDTLHRLAYRLPLSVEIITSNGKETISTPIRYGSQSFSISYSGTLKAINIDPGKTLLVQWNLGDAFKAYQSALLENCSRTMDLAEAMNLSQSGTPEYTLATASRLISNPNPLIRERMVRLMNRKPTLSETEIGLLLAAARDSKSSVRNAALTVLHAKAKDRLDLLSTFKGDSSYLVQRTALGFLAEDDSAAFMKEAPTAVKDVEFATTVATGYSKLLPKGNFSTFESLYRSPEMAEIQGRLLGPMAMYACRFDTAQVNAFYSFLLKEIKGNEELSAFSLFQPLFIVQRFAAKQGDAYKKQLTDALKAAATEVKDAEKRELLLGITKR